MTVHNKGWKANRDRAVLIAGYEAMCKEFRIARSKQLSAAEIARLSNEMLYKISKDLYSQATVKQANRLAVKMGLAEKPQTLVQCVLTWFKAIREAIYVKAK